MSEGNSEPKSVCEECKKPADLKCSGCRLVAYCSKEHQKQHWKQHKSLCRPIEVKRFQDKGRCLIASRDIKPGDLILTELPLVVGPRPHMVEEGPVPCPGCCRLILAKSAPRCEGCDWPVCHPACDGLRDPARHSHECLILGLRSHKALDGLHEYYRQDTLLALRCLMLQRKGIKKWLQLLEMESHMDKRGKGTEIYKDVDQRVVKYLYDNFIIPLKALEEQTKNTILPDLSMETLHTISGIIDVNALEINQNDAEISALYPTAYLMEHSCIPNTSHVFEFENGNYKIIVRAATPIKKGDHITTMYTHALWGTQARREHLRETKYFECKCSRCSDPTEMGTYLSALKCLGTELVPCGGIQLPVNPLDDKTEWACDKCQVKLSNNDVSYLINQIGEEVDQVQLSNPTVRELDNLLNKMLTFLNPNHYHCYAVKHSLIQLYGYQQGYLPNQISDELLKSKSRMCRELLDITRKIDPGNSRLSLYSGVLLHELYLSNICFVKRKWHVGIMSDNVKLLKEAKEALKDAKDVLKCELTSAAGEKLNQLVKTSEKELVKWMERSRIDLSKEETV